MFDFRSIIGRDFQGFKKNILAFVYRMPLVSATISKKTIKIYPQSYGIV